MASAKKLKEHLQKLDNRRGESPTLVPRQFVEDMDPGQALQLAEKVDGERGTTRLLYQRLLLCR